MNPAQQQNLTTIPLYIIREDLTHGDWEKSCTSSVKKLSIQIEEKITGDVIKVRLEWFNKGCQAELYADFVSLIATRLKFKSLNNIYTSDMIKQNMAIRYLDDEDDNVTISSWLELAHACCIIGNDPLKLEVVFSGAFKKNMELIKGCITDIIKTTNIRIAVVCKSGAKIHCGNNIFILNSNGVGILYFENEIKPLWRVYSNPKKASDFVYNHPLVRTYLFIHHAGSTPLIFVRHYPKGVHVIQVQGPAWPYYHIVEMDELPEAWSADEKKCGKGNVRLAFLMPVAYKAFDINGSCDYSVVLETKSRSFD